SGLEDNAAHTPDPSTSDLEELASPTGAAELLYVVLNETLPAGTALPASTTGANAFPCTWDSSASYTADTVTYNGCFGFTFEADPDFVEARYQANSDTPPAHTGNDPEFVLNQQGSSTKTVSPTLQGPNTTLVPWVASEQNGNPILYDATSARDVAAN